MLKKKICANIFLPAARSTNQRLPNLLFTKKKIIKHFLSVYGCLRQIIFEEKGRTITVSTYYVGFLKRIEVNFREERFTNSSFVNILLFASFIKRIITRAAGRNTSRFVWSKVIFSKFCRNLKISVFLTINQIVLSDG